MSSNVGMDIFLHIALKNLLALILFFNERIQNSKPVVCGLFQTSLITARD